MYTRKTKIVCTIGPATDTPEILRNMILHGMDAARLNFSHGSHEDHLKKVENIKRLREDLKRPVALLLDTKGPEIRIRTFAGDSAEIIAGQNFTLTTREVAGTPEIVSITYAGLPEAVETGTRILIDDGLIELIAEQITDTDIVCKVLNGGTLYNRKSVNLPGVSINMPYLDEKDKADLKFAYDNDFDFIALSFVRSARDVIQVRNYMSGFGMNRCELIAKIENAEGVANIDEIIRAADGVMVARGDLGVEIPFEDLPGVQKMMIKKCYSAGKKVITATQMLESMIHNPRPTRAEVTDIANAIYDGTSAIMLSGETASGKYPLESLETMVKIAVKTETTINYRERFRLLKENLGKNITNAISHATCTTAHDLEAAAIIAVTLSGSTARMISRFRPETRIIASTPRIKTYMQMALCWGVTPLLCDFINTPEELFKYSMDKVMEEGIAKDGDLIVITGSSSKRTSITDTLQVHILGNILVSGKGEGTGQVKSKAYIITQRNQGRGFSDGDIIVTDKTTKDILRFLSQAKGIVTEEDISDSGIVAAAIALDIPVIASAENATRLITDGSEIIIDPIRGLVYNSDDVKP